MHPHAEPRHVETRMMLIGAAGFMQAAETLHVAGGEVHWPAFFVNLCYAVELSLKAYLIKRGNTAEGVRRKYRHDLLKALDAACVLGYVPPSPDLREIVQHLSPLHARDELRYLRGGPLTVPDVAEALSIVRDHLQAIGRALPLGDLDP